MNHCTIAAHFLISLVVLTDCAAAQTAKHNADFALTLSSEAPTFVAQPEMDISINVEEKNISNHPVNAGRSMESGEWYKMVVLCDGKPAPITPEYRRVLTRPDPFKSGVYRGGEYAFWTIEPGHAQTFNVELSLYFDFSAPGKYEITFSRGTDEGMPDNVDVKSNTITITVLPS